MTYSYGSEHQRTQVFEAAVEPSFGGIDNCGVPVDSFVEASDGIRLAVRDHGGKGTGLLLLHGLGEHLVALDRLAAALVKQFRVVAMDVRWSGLSEASPRFDWSLPVDDVATVISDMSLSEGFVVGHSWGGIIATLYATTHPECPGVVNIDGWGFGEPSLYLGMDAEEAAAVIESLRQNADPLANFQRTGDREWAIAARLLLGRLVAARGVPEPARRAWIDRMLVNVGGNQWCIRPDPVAYDSMRTDARVFDALEQALCRVLVITSDVSTATNETVAARRRGVAQRLRTLQDRLPNLVVTSIPGSDHDSLIAADAEIVGHHIAQFAMSTRH
jgi:pimeloyl-ACP methyl ester carboxylesterase